MSEAKRRGSSGELTRLDQLGAAGAGALAAGVAPASHAAEPAATRDRWDVIVIGGGFCGLTAARECAQQGLATLLLEARARLGGRTFTAQLDGRATDLGGTWVHWSQPYVWAEIQRYGLPLVETPGATARRLIVRRADGDLAELDGLALAEQVVGAFAAYMGPSREIFPRPHSPFDSDVYRRHERVTAREAIERIPGLDPLLRDVLDGFIATCGANRPREVAWIEMVRWYALAGHDYADLNDAAARYHLRDGTVALVNAMREDARYELRLGAAVAKVAQEGEGVTVTTRGGEELRARAVVATLPLNLLRDVAWSPELPAAKLAASSEGHAGFSTKVHVVIEGEQNVACLAPSENALTWLFTEHAGEGQTRMVGFGPSPELLNVNDSAQVRAAVRSLLPDANVLRTFAYDWTRDPLAKGTWCVLRPGQYGKYLAALQEPQGRVVFASADWANGWRGFIDGAIEQGLVAGRRVRALLARSGAVP